MRLLIPTVLLVITVFVVKSVAQDAPKAKLIDEFGDTYCEELTTRIQILYTQVALNPGSRAVIVITGSNRDARLKNERHLWGYIKTANYDPSFLTEIRGPTEGKVRIQYWLVPKDAEGPNISPVAWDFTLPAKDKPYYLYSDNENALCESDHQANILGEYLAANADLGGRVIIHSTSLREFIQAKKEIVERLNKAYLARIAFVRKREKYEDDVEWWLVPSQKR